MPATAVATEPGRAPGLGVGGPGAPPSAPTERLAPDPPTAPSADPDPTLPGVDPFSALRAWWADRRHRTLAAVVVCGALLGATLALAFAAGNGGLEAARPQRRAGPARAAKTRPAKTRPARHRARAPRTVAPDDGERRYLGQLEALLQQSAAGRAQLVAVLRAAQGACALTPLAASQQLQAVVANRATVEQTLAALPAPPAPEAEPLRGLLQAAVTASAQADADYEGWMVQLNDANQPACAPADAVDSGPYRAGAQAADGAATALKTQFVAAFNPVAARFGLPTWSEADF